MTRLRRLRLTSPRLCVDLRLARLNGRWIASADTPDGPSMGLGWFPYEAAGQALAPFDELADELLEALPDELYWPAS
jgi:hypothetical protein